jgi:hypothetical protein
MSNLAKLREENNKPLTNPETINRSKAIQRGKAITSCLQAYIDNNETAFNSYSDRMQKLVKTIYDKAIDGNPSYLNTAVERYEGKVKEVVDISHSTGDIAPNQEEQSKLDDQFSNKSYMKQEVIEEAEQTSTQTAQISSGDASEFKQGESIQ